jgi:hypothetical protein
MLSNGIDRIVSRDKDPIGASGGSLKSLLNPIQMRHAILNPGGVRENGLSVLGIWIEETGVYVDDGEESIVIDRIVDDIICVLHVPHRLSTCDSPINLSNDIAMVVVIPKQAIPLDSKRRSDEDVMKS